LSPNSTKINWHVFSICIVALLNCAFLQKPVPPGSGRIQGTVCEFDGCSPIKGARVVIEIPNSGGLRRIATSGDAGGFQFTDLPAGRYVVEAEADDFISVAALPVIAIGDGGRAEDVKVFMRPFGSISGQALNGTGKAIASAKVEAKSFQSGPTTRVTTDDHGHFRLAGLGPGEYTIQLEPPVDVPGLRDYLPVFYPGTT